MIYPINMIYNGITTPTDPKINPFMQIIGSVFLFFLAIILTVKGWYIITSLSEVVSGDILLTVIFWMGLLTSWILTVIIAPISIIVQAQQQE